MSQKERLFELGSRAWEFRKQFGFSKKLSEDLRREAVQLCKEGMSPGEVGRALGIGRNSIGEWVKKYSAELVEPAGFKELSVGDDKPQFEIKVTATVEGVAIILTGKDCAHLQRMIRRLGG